jgi:hypothetical protein
MPIMNLAEEISRYLPTENAGASSSGSSIAAAGAGSLVGAVLGGLFGGNSDDRKT